MTTIILELVFIKKVISVGAILLILSLSNVAKSACDKTLNVPKGLVKYLRSPNWPLDYANGSSCRYLITAPTNYRIEATCDFAMFDVCFIHLTTTNVNEFLNYFSHPQMVVVHLNDCI